MSWKRWIGMLGLALCPDAAEALEGRVEDESGAPLANVTLSVLGRAQTARTDAGGRFVLLPDPQPPFELLAVLPGGEYAKPVTFTALPEDGPLVVRLTPSVSESVTVSGGAPGIRSAPASATTTVGREEMRARQPRNLTQALEHVPGVGNVSEGHASVPAIRGLAQARSLVLIDGARVTAERRIGPSATFLDPFVLQGVEISRGPGSVAYGSDALGGVILARTRRPRPGAPLSFELTGAQGTGVPQERLGVEVESGLGEGAGILFSAHHRDFDDYRSPQGEVPNSGSRDNGYLLSYAQLVPGGLLSVGVQADYGRAIERPRNNADVVRFYYPTEDSLRFTASYETGALLGFHTSSFSVFLGDYEIVTDQDTLGTATEPRRVARAEVEANDFGVRTDFTRPWGRTEVAFGIDLNGRFGLEAKDVTLDFDLGGTLVQESVFDTIEDARRIDAGFYVSADRALGGAVTLAGGLRYDRVRSVNDGGFYGDRSVSHDAPSGYAALTFGPFRGLSVTAQYARGFRDARLSDRFFRGVTGAGFITGNPDLDPEKSDQVDLALRWPKGRWRPAFYAYDYRIEELIERHEEEPDFFFFRNRGSARIRGIELEVSVDLPQEVTLSVAGAVAEGEARDDGAALDDVAPDNLSLQIRKGIGSRGFVQGRVSFMGKLDEPGSNEVPLDGRTLVDLTGGWRLGKSVELQLLLRNVLDETYPLTPDRRSPLAPGRSGVLTARAHF